MHKYNTTVSNGLISTGPANYGLRYGTWVNHVCLLHSQLTVMIMTIPLATKV